MTNHPLAPRSLLYMAWLKYDDAALWCARRFSSWQAGDALPPGLEPDVKALVDHSPISFAQRVRSARLSIAAGALT